MRCLRGAVRARPRDRPATYYAAQTRPPSAPARRDAELKPVVEAMHRDNYGVYGMRKMTAALQRVGVAIGRDQTGRLMRQLGLVGTRRGKATRTRSRTWRRPGRLIWSNAASLPIGRTSRRTDVVGIFPDRAALLHDEWTETRRYIGLDVLARSRRDQPDTPNEEVPNIAPTA